MSRPYFPPQQIFTNTSMTTTVHSAPENISQVSYIGFDISWTGAPVGSFSVEVSNTFQLYPGGQTEAAGNWTALTLSAPVAAAGTSGNAFIDIDGVSSTWIRLTYTAASGTGTLNATLSGKVI